MKQQSEDKFRFTLTWKLTIIMFVALALAVFARDLLSAFGLGGVAAYAVAGLIALVLLIALLIVIRRAVVTPLKSIMEAWRALGEGDFQAEFTVNSHDEIGAVATSCRAVKA